jgi:2,3-bisphosphoglycerate-independent phosphoglycerate mutase
MINNEKNGPTMLIILDGFGYRKDIEGNAIAASNMPNWKKWLKVYPNKLLNASGKAVGLLPGYMGNSEVGHTTIGCGRIIKTVLAKFHEKIEDKSFFKNELLIKNFEKLKQENKALHLMGLLSDAGVHSHEKHLFALIKLASTVGVEKVFIHTFLDGRDTPPKSASTYLKKLETVCKQLNCGKIASIHGRFYAMDRDNNWNRTQVSYNVLTQEKNINNFNWQAVLQNSYDQNITDEFVQPTLLIKDGTIKNGDGIVFFNFRSDRARQLTESFINPNFDKFATNITLSFFISTTRYKKEFENFNNQILFKKDNIEHTLLDEISKQTSKKVFIIAETEKFAHVTYFFRGMTEKNLPNEQYTLIPSIKTKNYINNPEMSAQKITDTILKSLQTNPAYFYLINYANPDMVGHSGNFDATVKACEYLDKQLKVLYDQVVEKQNGTIFITADHGNAEEMLGKHQTSHTTNPIIFMEINKKLEKAKEAQQEYTTPTLGLSNIAPTILKHLNLKIPQEMEQTTIF